MEWAEFHRACGYSAAFCPVDADADENTVRAYATAALEADLLIAEVGAWSNPIDPDDQRRKAAIGFCQRQLDLAERIGARCCVNISGSRTGTIRGPSRENLSEDTFALIADTVREIIDAVRPTRSFYALEMMPWLHPDSPESYLRLLDVIDRDRFGVHLDPVNIITSPRHYFHNAELIRRCFRLLGPHIKSCHAKDVKLSNALTVHIDEARPGTGALDYRVFVAEIDALGPDMPLMLEHLATDADYAQASEYIREVASDVGVTVK
jgi:sugar phosphate isomerase/epimerase